MPSGIRQVGDSRPNIVAFRQRTYSAKSFTADSQYRLFYVSGTLDGFVDEAIPQGKTYPLSIRVLLAALQGAMDDVTANCLYERDALLLG